MSTPIVLFFLVGAVFGLATGHIQHLFSEGAARPPRPGERVSLRSRLMWVLISSCLWPILLLSGAASLMHRARVRARTERPRDR